VLRHRENQEKAFTIVIFSIDISDKPRVKNFSGHVDPHSLVTAHRATMSLGSQTDLPGILGSEPPPGFPAAEWSWNDDLTMSLLQAASSSRTCRSMLRSAAP